MEGSGGESASDDIREFPFLSLLQGEEAAKTMRILQRFRGSALGSHLLDLIPLRHTSLPASFRNLKCFIWHADRGSFYPSATRRIADPQGQRAYRTIRGGVWSKTLSQWFCIKCLQQGERRHRMGLYAGYHHSHCQNSSRA